MREVVTRAKIAELPDRAELKVAAGTIFTRAARELIKEKGIVLRFIEEGVLTPQQKPQQADGEIERGIVTVIGHVSAVYGCYFHRYEKGKTLFQDQLARYNPFFRPLLGHF